MKKKIIIFITCLLLILSFAGCKRMKIKYSDDEYHYIYNRFVLVEKYSSKFVSDSGGVTFVVYDEDTKVMYYIIDSYNQCGITPIYNSDGTIKLYEK